MNNENLFRALGVFIDAMRNYTISTLKRHFPDDQWEGIFFSRLTAGKQSEWNRGASQGTAPQKLIDYGNLSFLASKFRDELGAELGDKSKTYNFESCISELREVRNKCQHYQTIEKGEADRAFSNMVHVAQMIGAEELHREISRLQQLGQVTAAAPSAAPASPSAANAVQSQPADDFGGNDNGTLLPWFRNCLPSYDLRSGVLDESSFAANLSEVALGIGAEDYTNSSSFFDKTYITAGMRDIASRVVRALNGEESGNNVISLQTGFGGGKTHTLISIYHIAKGGAQLLSSPACAGMLSPGVFPNFSGTKVAVFTNNTTDVTQGRTTEEGVTIHTLWGEIAYQIGGLAGYERMRPNDEQLTAPNAAILKPILEEAGTSLILIDELADYCNKAAGRTVGASNLYYQTVSFVQTLSEVVASLPRCVLIATLPASANEIADSRIGQEILDALQNRLVRIATNVKPVDDEEVYEVIRRRLFENIADSQMVSLVAEKYKKMYCNRRTDVPDYSTKKEYADRIRKAYPFHPELIEILRQRWGSFHKFQRTRGVLRLLASVVQDLWRRRSSLTGSHPLIQTSDVYLENLNPMTAEITRLKGTAWESVMLADVYGASSNSRKIDEEDPSSQIGQYRLTESIATTLLMASIGASANTGLSMKEIKLCLLIPGNTFNHNSVDGALNKLEQKAHYLHSSNVGESVYWFDSKANVNILLIQAKAEVSADETDAEVLRRLRSAADSVQGLNVLVNPTGDVPEQKRLTMVILHPSLCWTSSGISGRLRQAVETMALTRGNSSRSYRNTMFYLACSEAGRSALSGCVRDFLSCDKVLQEYAGRLEPDQRIDINNRKQEYGRQADSALVKAYCVVLKHSGRNGIDSIVLNSYAQSLSAQINDNLKREMEENEWLVKSVGRNVLQRNNLLPAPDRPVKVKDVYEAFLRFDDKPMIYGEEAIVTTVNRYCSGGVFCVAFGTDGNYTRIYRSETVNTLDVNSDDFWLVDNSTELDNHPEVSPEAPAGGGVVAPVVADPEPGSSDTPQVKTYRRLTVSGTVPIENYSQLYTSFINILKNNNLKIEIKFTAKTTTAMPLNESSPIVKSVKESASQLGLDFFAEE